MSKAIKLKSGQEVDRCQECQRDWDVVKHAAGGLCRGCNRMKQHKEAKPPQRWSEKFDYCQGQECPNTEDNITSQPHNADGLCRSCYSSKQRYVDLEHSHVMEATRRAQPGFAEKQKTFYDAWYEKNRERHIENVVKYGQEHPEWRREQNAKYREANREVCRASFKKWYYANEENKEKSVNQYRKWREEHPEESRQHNRNRRARLANAEGEFTVEEWLQCCEDHNFQCYHCHKGIDDGILLTPDHLVPIIKSGSNFISNIAPLCESCNSSKKDRDLQEFDIEYFGIRFLQ
jgi:hypothetical protein